MNKTKLIFAGLGAFGVFAFIVLGVIAVLMHESFSVLNSFVGELGKYPSGYLGFSPALLFNIGLVVSGLLTMAFFVGYGLKKESVIETAFSFFGILTGALVAAQGVFTLNNVSAHYIFTTILFASAFITGAIYVVTSLLPGSFGKASLAGLLTAFAAAAAGAVFAVFVQIGNMPYILGVPFTIRIKVIPFAIVEWAALLLLFAFIGLLCVKMILSALKEEDTGEKDGLKVKKPSFSFKKKKQESNLDF